MLRRIALGVGILVGLLALYVVFHLVLIEVGREVVVLHKWVPDGGTRATRLWIVDDGGVAWLHHGYPDSPWIQHLAQDPIVVLERAGEMHRYRATPDASTHERLHRLFREKYGFADWWVRFISRANQNCPAQPVRLERIDE